MPPLPSTARQVQADAIVVKHGMSVITSELPSALTVQSPTKAKAPAVVGGSFGRRHGRHRESRSHTLSCRTACSSILDVGEAFGP